jgi:hypothetical protein
VSDQEEALHTPGIVVRMRQISHPQKPHQKQILVGLPNFSNFQAPKRFRALLT